MRIVLQKVRSAAVSVEGQVLGAIQRGYVLLLGVMEGDAEEQARWLARKIVNLRLFEDENGRINDKNILDVQGGILVISQFTLAADIANGNRPDYTAAAGPDAAAALYERFIGLLGEQGVATVASGRFGAHMEVELVNDGPVTLIVERT